MPTPIFSPISSPSNPKIKEAAKLRDGKYRRRQGRFLIDGLREIQRAAESGIRFLEIFCLQEKAYLVDSIRNDDPAASTYLLSDQAFDKIAFGNRNEGVVVVAKTPDRTPETFLDATAQISTPLLAVLENVEKPGNVGAVFRSADGAGFDGVLIADPSGDLFNPNTVRSSLGTVFRTPSFVADSKTILRFLKKQKIRIAAARCDGAIPYTDYDFTQPTAIVLGSEADGLTDLWTENDITALSLPMLGIADSLNISNAASILFYEARRQREAALHGIKGPPFVRRDDTL